MNTDAIKHAETGLGSAELTRRSAIRKITVSVGVLAGISMLPEQWTKPIIGQVILPAHAGTSGSSLHDPCTVTLLEGNTGTPTVTVRVDGFVTPPTANLQVSIFANGNADRGAIEAKTTTNAAGTFTATLVIQGGPGLTSVSVTTNVTGADGVARCSVHFSEAPATTPAPATTSSSSWT